MGSAGTRGPKAFRQGALLCDPRQLSPLLCASLFLLSEPSLFNTQGDLEVEIIHVFSAKYHLRPFS